jgi:hypothetical protein
LYGRSGKSGCRDLLDEEDFMLLKPVRRSKYSIAAGGVNSVFNGFFENQKAATAWEQQGCRPRRKADCLRPPDEAV